MYIYCIIAIIASLIIGIMIGYTLAHIILIEHNTDKKINFKMVKNSEEDKYIDSVNKLLSSLLLRVKKLEKQLNDNFNKKGGKSNEKTNLLL
jgi:MFS superfamily sulfate permease-like transporter